MCISPVPFSLQYPAPPRTLPRAHGTPIEDLFYCIKNGGEPCSNFPGASGPLTEFALLGLLAQDAGIGNPVEWNVEEMACTNMPEINQYVQRPVYRPHWGI